MRKLHLELDHLAVDTFHTSHAPAGMGPQQAEYLLSQWNNTVLYDTQQVSCGGTCGTCGGTDCWA